MTIYVGEQIVVRASAVNPATGQIIDDAQAVVEFFAPGKRPITVPEDRQVDRGPFDLAFNLATQTYVGYVGTTGWPPGKWTARVTLSEVFDSWEYQTFQIKP